ncbi:hypothetical protein JH298_21790 (plasmid) [Xanthomonas campestris pv. campestris]|uniref:hypothetical protein n=1 Tax=Xanthomonas TaxID=338 RepID=UPI000CEE6D83|nr:hypothetical protein [Xanthomonas arboricola]PPU05588.1 hypothetical protein XarjCFBP1022_20070 [Xanthomonas arboricola]WDJ74924.1 hypothetical protein JH298_21790 [Xanthomonas campestris pv. campestris]
MTAFSDNVVPLFRHGIPARDAESIESMLLLATGGDEVTIDEVEITSMTIASLATRFGVGPDMELRGLVMPVSRWLFPLECCSLELFVVDAGGYRAFCYRPSRAISGVPSECDIRR